MKKIKNKILLMSILSALSTGLSSCSSEELYAESSTRTETIVDIEKMDELDSIPNAAIETENLVVESDEITVVEEETEVPVEKEESIIIEYPSITASTNVNIRDNAINGNILGVLKEGSSLKLLEVLDNGWYKVEYYDNIGYISSEYAYESISYDINTDIKKICYATEEIKITPIIPDAIVSGNDLGIIVPALECLEVYEEDEDKYLVKTNDYIGYIDKVSIVELTGTFVVVDISDQELKLYSNNEIVLRTPVVTGKPSTPSDQGLFEIYNISGPRYLVGPNYRSYVDIMMKYNDGEGLHDAEYHSHEDGFNHGWRDISEFGGDTYLTDGSHGCVNMIREDVLEVSEYVDLGTKVLVKQ